MNISTHTQYRYIIAGSYTILVTHHSLFYFIINSHSITTASGTVTKSRKNIQKLVSSKNTKRRNIHIHLIRICELSSAPGEPLIHLARRNLRTIQLVRPTNSHIVQYGVNKYQTTIAHHYAHVRLLLPYVCITLYTSIPNTKHYTSVTVAFAENFSPICDQLPVSSNSLN